VEKKYETRARNVALIAERKCLTERCLAMCDLCFGSQPKSTRKRDESHFFLVHSPNRRINQTFTTLSAC